MRQTRLILSILGLAVCVASAATTVPSTLLLDINTATVDELKALPGMGAAYAQRVVEGRPYTAKNQLVTRGVLPQTEYERIAGLIIAKRPPKDASKAP